MGLDKIIEQRQTQKSIGIWATIPAGQDRDKMVNEILKHTQPDDLVRFGMIPEFIGRLPVAAID